MKISERDFTWNADYCWYMMSLKYLISSNLNAFSSFAVNVLKKTYKFDAISLEDVSGILSLYTESPNITKCSAILKVPEDQLEFCSFISNSLAG